MQNFRFLNPTEIIFGKGNENLAGEECKKYGKKVLLHYGGQTIKTTGLYQKIIDSLQQSKVNFVELGGVEPNPKLSLVRKGIKLCISSDVDFILAVGGGSVIDSAKAIAAGVFYKDDVWDLFLGKEEPNDALPIGVVLTIPASGSEASWSSVITNEDGNYKRYLNSSLLYPKFSILNPELTYSLPNYQTACGACDIMAHVMERYFTLEPEVEFTDRLCEAALQTVINNVTVALKEPKNYGARAQIMWTAAVAHNDFLGTGRIADFASHMISHELSAINDVAHGAALSVIFPAWMKYVYKNDVQRFVQFAVRVWDVKPYSNDYEKTALEGIDKTEKFFKDIGLPTRLKEIGIKKEMFNEIAEKCVKFDGDTVGNFVKVNPKDIVNILHLAE